MRLAATSARPLSLPHGSQVALVAGVTVCATICVCQCVCGCLCVRVSYCVCLLMNCQVSQLPGSCLNLMKRHFIAAQSAPVCVCMRASLLPLYALPHIPAYLHPLLLLHLFLISFSSSFFAAVATACSIKAHIIKSNFISTLTRNERIQQRRVCMSAGETSLSTLPHPLPPSQPITL